MILVKKLYDKLVAKVSSIDTSRFLLKTKYDTDKTELGNKIPDAKMPSISGLAINSALTAAENKILNISRLDKKTNYDTKITEIEKKLMVMIMVNILLLQILKI